MDRLLMIYNADGGLVNGALDLLHKTFSPATYPCRLCEVTYGTFGMKRDWRTTIEALPLPVTSCTATNGWPNGPGIRHPCRPSCTKVPLGSPPW
jgi:hypothetical protein